MLFFPNAKINIGLYVTGKRPDGFHNIESVFVPIALCDALDIAINDGSEFELEVLGITIDGKTKDNICFKAWKLLQAAHNISGVKCQLLKNIPTGAGLGGGSADGAFMLKALNNLFKLNLNNAQLKQYAAELGSDCPFFIDNSPKFVSGRGEILEDVTLDLSRYFITIVRPGIHISTPQAYSLIKPVEAKFNLRKLEKLSINDWKEKVSNDFESPIAELHPQINHIKERLYQAGAVYASMSGSGSAVYGIFENKQDLSQTFTGYFCRTVAFL